MTKRRRINASTRELRLALDALGRSDPEAYEIGYWLAQDFTAVQNGHWKSMAGHTGQKLYDRAPPNLQKRAIRMFGIILRLTTTEFDQPPTSPPRRRFWRRK